MWPKWLAGVVALLAALAMAVGYALRKRATEAAALLGRAVVDDAEARGREAVDKARLEVIDGELKLPLTPAKRTAGQVLEEQRRRGQLKE